MERLLLESVLAAMEDHGLYTGKGLKTHAWRQIQSKVEKRFKIKFHGDVTMLQVCITLLKLIYCVSKADASRNTRAL